MPPTPLADLHPGDHGARHTERELGGRVVPITIPSTQPHPPSPDAWRWAEQALESLPLWDERARAHLVAECGRARTTASNYIFSLSSIAAPRFLEMFGLERWSVDFGDYARTLELLGVRLDLEARRAVFEYGLDGCLWPERLLIPLKEDGTLGPIEDTRGGKAPAELDRSAHGTTRVCFEDRLDTDTLLQAVDSLGVPGLAVYEITRGFVGAFVTTELTLEGPADSLAIARMLRDTLVVPVVLSAWFGTPWGWLLLDPQRGEWLVDEDPRDPHVICCRAPFRFDRWEKRPASATGVRSADWTPKPFDGVRPEPRSYTNLVLPRDLPLPAVEEAAASAGGSVVWTSQWDHCCTDVTFACASSAVGSLAFARSLASVLRREVIAGMFLREGPAWVRLLPDGSEDLVRIGDASPVHVYGPFDPLQIEVPPLLPEPWPAPKRGDADPPAAWASSGPPVYTNVYVASDVSDAEVNAAVEAMAVEAVVIWRCGVTQAYRAHVLRSTANSLAVARAVAAKLAHRVIVGLALRGDPGWVVIDPGEPEWLGTGWEAEEELRFLRTFDEADLLHGLGQ